MYREQKIGIVIPYYNDAGHIKTVVQKLPDFIDTIMIVDDRSQEPLPVIQSKKVFTHRNEENSGVGGATITGWEKIAGHRPDIVVKMDADDQMDPRYLTDLLDPIIDNRAEFTKGNRFQDFQSLKKMPFLRRLGNLGLSFLCKMATGYWNNFDPTNGFFAIRTSLIEKLNKKRLHPRFFFETSLMAELYFHNARIMDVPMGAIYNDEKSSLKIGRELFKYPFRLFKIFIRRIILTYYFYDFNMASLYMLMGIPLFLFGVIYGLQVWHTNAVKNILTPTGTIMIITLSIILGFQLILQAIQIDIEKSPKPS